MARSPRDTIIVMTRLPREGGNKTRLIPAIGASGAMQMHDRLARHAIGRASAYALMNPGTRLMIFFEGGTRADCLHWLGSGEYRLQSDGDLGERLRAAVAEAFSDGAERVLVMGTDCPGLDEALIGEGFASLKKKDLVFGPAEDGGYYLIGMKRPCDPLFKGIEWGGSKVLAQSLNAANQAGWDVALLDSRRDVDFPEDLTQGEAELQKGASVSVIVPVLNEAARISEFVKRLLGDAPSEVLVVDGGSRDETAALADRAGARVIEGPRGRAAQMNLGASLARGEFLLFLHADTLPPKGYPAAIVKALMAPGTSAGAFRFEMDGDLAAAPLIESLVNLRCRAFGTPYGDQGIFIRRSLFHHLGGFPDWPVMEDLDLIRRLNRLGKVRLNAEPAMTSSRRWEKCGMVRTFLRHQTMLGAYHVGVPPKTISSWFG